MASIDLEYNSGFQIYNSDGTPFHDLVLHKCTYETVVMSLGDKISGILYYKDNALDVTMSEYIIYKGVRYTLVNPPTILREGLVSDNSELRGMTKYSFTFYHPMYVLNNFPFSDIAVQSGQNRYLSQNKTFSWIGTLVDFVAKLNKNLEDTQWMVTIGNVTQEEQTKLSEVLSFDKNTIAEALKRGYETWEVPYVVDQLTTSSPYYPEKRFVVQYGLPTTEILDEYNQPFVFQMGKGVGLKNNSRNPKNNKIITRIAGYGSEDNIPYGYPQIPYYGGDVEYPLYYGIVGGQRVQLIKHPFTRNHLMPSVYSQSVYNKVNPKLSDGSNNPNYDPNIELVDYYDANDNTYTNRIKPNSPSYEIHEFGDIKPELGEKSIISAVPVSQQETQPDYKQKSDFLQEILDRISATEIEDEKTELLDVYDRVDAGLSYYKKHGEEGGDTYWFVFSITRDNYYEYVSYESSNYNFTATVLRNGSSAPTPDWDDTMDDDGNYLQSYFKITLPILEFDLYACAAITQEMKINMRSGACIGCTFPVEVDWDDYKRNFYNSDGEFDPDGEQRDYTKYPDSSSGQITVMVKKELETFGTLMPNQYQQPTTGDKFVILGISLPNTYITSAEQRLDTDMKQYMRDNNVYYYDYPLKFDEHFLISHEDILSQMKNNVVVRFNYAGTEHALYIKQMSVKYNESPLPKYDITLTDDIEIVLNQIGQVTDEVSKLRLGFGAGGFGTIGAEYIRKDIDDTARGTIRMIKGMQVGERFVTGLLGEGGVFRKDSDGTTYLETDKLYVRMKAYFDTVEVKHYLHTGGNRIASQASGIVCSRVEMIDAYGGLAMDVSDAVLFRCFFKANDGDKTIRNDFKIGDLAFCHETNVDVSEINMHGYWRLVIGRNYDGFLTENKEAWIDLSNRASDSVVVGGVEYRCAGYQNGSDAPIAQDDIIQLGNITDKDRQGAIVEYVGGDDAPSYQIFQGIGEDLPYPYTLEDKNYIGLGYSSQTGHAYMNVYGDVFIGAKPDAVTGESPTYIKYDSVDKKLTIKAIIDGSSPIGDTDTTIEQALADLLDDITDLQSQIDGSIETFFNDYMPVAKTQEGAPANRVPLVTITIDGHTIPCEPYYSWYTADHGGTASEVNTERLKHLGDIFYDNTSGYAFRFSQNESTHVFEWVEITDSAVIKALRDAAEAYGLADTKNKIFTTVAGQLPPYPWKEGDLWVNATYPADGSIYSNDILKCKQDRTSDGSITDWTLASKYTDDKKVERYTNILTGSVQPSESSEKEIALAAENAIRTALGGNFILDGGLMLMSIIGMRKLNQGGDPSDPDDYTTWAGISGVYDDNLYGGGIAAWYGGGLVDKRNPTTGEYDVANGAKSGFRFDGSGWLADGNINWNAQGAMVIKNIETIYGTGNDSISINELSALTSIFHTETYGSGNITELLIKPQNAYSQLFINRSGNPLPASSYPQDHTINEYSVLNYGEMKARFVPLEFFNALFTAYSDANHTNAINPWTWTDTAAASRAAINNLKILVGTWTEQYLSALGHNSQQGGGGGIGDVTWEALAGAGNQQINISHLSSAGVATQSWVRSQLGGSVVRVDVGTDQYFPSGGVVSLPAYPTTLPASDVSAWAKADTKPEYSFSEITGSLTESDIPSLSWSKITTGKPTSWWGASSIDANGAVKGSMSNVGDIAFSASGKNIGGLLYFIISQTTPQIKVGSDATLVQYAYSNGTFTPKLYVDGYAGVNGEIFAKGLELVGSDSAGNKHGGYIDFHYSKSASDYTSRIIEKESGLIQLSTKIQTSRIYLYKPNANDTDAVYLECDTDHNVKLVGNFYATGAVSALGSNSQQGGTGVTLNQPLSAINSAGLSAPTVNGSVLVYSNNVWKYSNNAGIFATSLSVAGTASAAGFSATGKDNTYVLLAGSGTSKLKTINGNSIFGDGDIVISGGDTTAFIWRGIMSSDYAYITDHSSGATGYFNPPNGVWKVKHPTEDWYPYTMLTFTASGNSASGLDVMFGFSNDPTGSWSFFKYRRRIDSNRVLDWETFITSTNIGSANAGSATKLQTARTIWGRSFDGSGNISGAIEGATTITASGNVSIGGSIFLSTYLMLGKDTEGIYLTNEGIYWHNASYYYAARIFHFDTSSIEAYGVITSNENVVRKTAIDATKSNNGVSSIQYPTTFDIVDKDGRILVRSEGVVKTNGDIAWQTYVRNYNTSGTAIASKGISYTIDKNGTGTWYVGDSESFRNAIGVNISNFVTLGTEQTIAGSKTFSGSISTDGGIIPLTAGNVNTIGSNNVLLFKQATISADSPIPNNGLVIEYGIYSGYHGQLWFGDNASVGLYWNGWTDGTRGSWKKIAFTTDKVSDSTLFDGYSSSIFLRRSVLESANLGEVTTQGVYRLQGNESSFEDAFPNCSWSTMFVAYGGGDTLAQIGFPYSQQTAYLRNGTLNGIKTTSWREFAFIDSNVASATVSASCSGNAATSTSLQTTRKIWGQDFNGTQNIYNDLYLAASYSDNANANSKAIRFYGHMTEGVNGPWIMGINESSYGRKRIAFIQHNAASFTDAGTEVMSILPNGNVGIGTYQPSSKLFVSGSTFLDGGIYTSDRNFFFNTDGEGIYIHKNGISWHNSSNTYVRTLLGFDSNGNAGMGTGTPSYKLHVVGDIYSTANLRAGDSFLSGSQMRIGAVNYQYHFNMGIGTQYIWMDCKDASNATKNNLAIWPTCISTWGNILLGSGDGTYIQIGGARIVWDNTNKALKVIQSDNSTAANFYATGAVSALGANTSSGGGGGNYVTLDGTQTITGAKTFNATVQITQKLTVNNSIEVSGAISSINSSIACAHDITGGGNLSMNGRATIAGTATIGGYMTIGATEAVGTVNSQVIQTLNRRAIYIKTGSASNFVDGTWSSTSDVRLKDIINNVGASVDQIANAPIFNYKWKSGGVSIMLGSSAQYWQKVFQHAVEIGPENYLYMDYSSVALASAVMVARKVQNHEDRIAYLERENEQLRNEIKQLKAA